MGTIKNHFGQGFPSGQMYTILKNLDNTALDAEITVGTEAQDTINVEVQLKDWNGDNLATYGMVDIYISTNAAGYNIDGKSNIDSELDIGTNGKILVLDAKKYAKVLSSSAGKFDIDIVEAGESYTIYLVVVLPTGAIKVSGAITFANAG